MVFSARAEMNRTIENLKLEIEGVLRTRGDEPQLT